MNKTYYKGDISSLEYFVAIEIYRLGRFVERRNEFSPEYLDLYDSEIGCYASTDHNRLFSSDILKIINELKYFIRDREMDVTGQFPSLFKIVHNKLKLRFYHDIKTHIIFELIVDESGEQYGKELYTGLLFPIINKSNKNNLIINDYLNYDASNDCVYCKTKTTINNAKLDKIDILLHDIEVADTNEVNDYLELKKHKRKLKRRIKKITELANKNVFNSEIVPMVKKEVVREKQDELTIMMENIEFLLEKLGTINNELKNKYEKEYEELLNGEQELLTIKSITKTSLSVLEGKIQYAISYSKASSADIVTYLDDLKKEYLNNFINNMEEKTPITLEEIDKLNELFLKTKSSYNLKVQRKVIRNISFIYLMEVYENINTITEVQLENSYFNDNKKSIVIAIESLLRADLIESNIIIDFNNELTIHELLNIISKIRFKQNTENRGITKKLEI